MRRRRGREEQDDAQVINHLHHVRGNDVNVTLGNGTLGQWIHGEQTRGREKRGQGIRTVYHMCGLGGRS